MPFQYGDKTVKHIANISAEGRTLSSGTAEASRYLKGKAERFRVTENTLSHLRANPDIRNGLWMMGKYTSEQCNRVKFEQYGIPPTLFGLEVTIEPEGALPNGWAVIDAPDSPEAVLIGQLY